MKTRIVLGFTLLASLCGIFTADYLVGSDLGFTFLLCLTVGLGLHEFYTMYESKIGAVPKRLGVFLGLCLVVASWMLRHTGHAGWVQAILYLAIFLLASIFVLDARPERAPQVVCLAFGLVYVWLPMDYVARLRDIPVHGQALVFYLFLTSKCNDMGAYFTGRACGRRKLSPNVSPGKTIEGSIGGLLIGTACGLTAWGAMGLTVRSSWGQALVITVLTGVASQLGDLFESYFKRYTGHKDSGALLPSFGGMLDMIDSFLLCGPIGYMLILGLGDQA